MYERPLRPDELMHFGILGMHWGIRRYQNPDGTLTKAGKIRKAKQDYKDLAQKQIDLSKQAIKDVSGYSNIMNAGMELSKLALKNDNIDYTKFKRTPHGTIVSNMDVILDKSKNSDSKFLREYYNICKNASDIHTKHMKEGTLTFIDKAYENGLNITDKWAYTSDYLLNETQSQKQKRREKQLILQLLMNSTNDGA